MQHVRQPESWRQFGQRTNSRVSRVRKITCQYETRSAGDYTPKAVVIDNHLPRQPLISSYVPD